MAQDLGNIHITIEKIFGTHLKCMSSLLFHALTKFTYKYQTTARLMPFYFNFFLSSTLLIFQPVKY